MIFYLSVSSIQSELKAQHAVNFIVKVDGACFTISDLPVALFSVGCSCQYAMKPRWLIHERTLSPGHFGLDPVYVCQLGRPKSMAQTHSLILSVMFTILSSWKRHLLLAGKNERKKRPGIDLEKGLDCAMLRRGPEIQLPAVDVQQGHPTFGSRQNSEGQEGPGTLQIIRLCDLQPGVPEQATTLIDSI